MLNRRNAIFCVIAVLIIIASGSVVALKVINDSNNSENDTVNTIETQSSDGNLISALENQTTSADDSKTDDEKVQEYCKEYIENMTGYDTEGASVSGNFVTFSGLVDADAFWTVKIGLKNGKTYGFNAKYVGDEIVITDVFSLSNDENNQKLVLTDDMQDYLDEFNRKLDAYIDNAITGDTGNDYDYDYDYEEDYDYYYHIIYNGTDNDLSYQKVKLSGLGDYLGITEENAKDSYTQKELEELLNNVSDGNEYSDELPDDYDYEDEFEDDDDVWEMSEEMSDKIQEYIIERRKDFIDNPKYDEYVEKALEAFKNTFKDKVTDDITAEAYLDVIVNDQTCIAVRLVNNSQQYWIVLNENYEITRISTSSNIFNGTEQTQLY